MARKTVLRHKDIVIAATLAALDIAAVVLVQIMIIMPVVAKDKHQQQKMREMIQELESNSQKRRECVDLSEKNKSMRAQLAVFDKRIPASGEIAALMAEVLRAADQNGLKILHTKPQEPVALGQGFQRFPFELDLVGEYHAVGRLVAWLESHRSYVQVHSVNCSTVKDGSPQIRMSLSLYGTSVSPDSQPAEAAASAAPLPAARRPS